MRQRHPVAVASEKVWCPYCLAGIGEGCKKKDGTPLRSSYPHNPHSARSALARKRGLVPAWPW